MKAEIALRKTLLGKKKVTEERDLGTVAYEIKRKREYHAKKVELKLGGEKEVDCTWGR